MTRTATTKFVATALAVASLGIAGTAQASDAEQGIAIGEPTPGQPIPAQPAGPDTPEQPVVDPVPETNEQEEVDYDSDAYFKSHEAKKRFERYCHFEVGEPSHNDKKFCERYRAVNSSSSGGKRPDHCEFTNIVYDPECEKPSPTGHGTSSSTHEGTPQNENENEAEYEEGYDKPEHYQEAEKGSLAFTGLEIWQLGLLAIVLIGGGLGVRRLIAA